MVLTPSFKEKFDRFVQRRASLVTFIHIAYVAAYILALGWVLYIDDTGWVRTSFGRTMVLAGVVLLIALSTLRFIVEIREKTIRGAAKTHDEKVFAEVQKRFKTRPSSINRSQDE